MHRRGHRARDDSTVESILDRALNTQLMFASAERAPLMAKDGADVETAQSATDDTYATASERSGDEDDGRGAKGWSRSRRVAACVSLTAAAAFGVVTTGVSGSGESNLGRGLPLWRREWAAGNIPEGRQFSESIPPKTCDARQSRGVEEDIEKYFIYQALQAEATATLGLSRKARQVAAKRARGPEAHYITGMANNDTEAPYLLPKDGYAKKIRQRGNTAMLYNFVHVPKAGGTYFNEVLASVQRQIDNKYGKALNPREVYNGGWMTAPLVDATANNIYATTRALHAKEKSFSTATLAKAYDKGQRLMSKGSYNMGLCSATEAPCMYLMVLRDPFDRFMSHYKYSCLEGAEGRAMWAPQWKAAGECPLNPLQWFYFTQGDDWTQLISPGTYPRDTQCHVDGCINNLKSGCVRYLLTENLADGLRKMKDTLPDFAGLDLQRASHMFTNGSSGRLNKALKERLATYMADKAMLNKIKEGLAHQQKIYQFAVDNYEESWASELKTC